MVVRKSEISNASYRVASGLYGQGMPTVITPQKLAGVLKTMKADPKIGKTGADALKAAYDAAKTAAGTNPTREQVQGQISKAISSLTNENAKGRINDGYVDAREAAGVKGDLAKAIYAFVGTSPAFNHSATPAEELKASATQAQIAKAVAKLSTVIDAGFKLYKQQGDPDLEGPEKALREAAQTAGLSADGRAALMTALNGATTRSDGGDYPGAADVKAMLTRALAKLKLADGALIVDLDKPNKAPTRKRDQVTTGVELDRTPAATGKTSRALLRFAGTL